jgi:hypothetical protein
MKKLLSVLTATILAAAFAMPLKAAPMFVPKPEQVRADILQKVDDDRMITRRDWRRRHHREWREDNHWQWRHAWLNCRYYNTCYPRRYYDYDRYGERDYYPRHYRRPGITIYVPIYRN